MLQGPWRPERALLCAHVPGKTLRLRDPGVARPCGPRVLGRLLPAFPATRALQPEATLLLPKLLLCHQHKLVSPTLQHFTSQREEFEGSRESILVWLTEMDLQLTNVEHFSESGADDKMRQLNVRLSPSVRRAGSRTEAAGQAVSPGTLGAGCPARVRRFSREGHRSLPPRGRGTRPVFLLVVYNHPRREHVRFQTEVQEMLCPQLRVHMCGAAAKSCWAGPGTDTFSPTVTTICITLESLLIPSLPRFYKKLSMEVCLP